MNGKDIRHKQYEVARHILDNSEAYDHELGLDDYNVAFAAAKLPEITDGCDLICLINGDLMDPATMRMSLEEMLLITNPQGDTTIGEAARKIGTDEQVEALVQKRVAKRLGGSEH